MVLERSFTSKQKMGAVVAGLVLARQAYKWLTMSSLKGKVVLVTGGSRGLGFLLAREFAREGCKVAICARDEDELSKAAMKLRRRGAPIFALPCDVTKPAEVSQLVESVRHHFGRIDILVNNAGVIQVMPLEQTREVHYREAMEVMFWGTFHPTMAVLPDMQRAKDGHIVNITSIGGVVSVPHLVPYNCAKFAAFGFSQGIHAELKKDDIHVTTVVPSTMRTGSHVRALFGGDRAKEFKWFSLSATLPVFSKNAERAAQRIVRAVKRREPSVTLGLPAKIAIVLNGIAPGFMADVMAVVNRFLPSAPAEEQPLKRGQEVLRKMA